MQFTLQTITILNRCHQPEKIEAMVGEDSGLGYYVGDMGFTTNGPESPRDLSGG